MDIALLSMAMNQGKIQQQASLSVMKMAMDQSQGDAAGLLKIMSSADAAQLQHSVQPHLGGNVDLNA